MGYILNGINKHNIIEIMYFSAVNRFAGGTNNNLAVAEKCRGNIIQCNGIML